MPVRPLVDALLAGDREAAREIALQVHQQLNSRVGVFVDLLQPAQYEIGELWYRGEITVEDEHRATAVTQRITEELPATPSSTPVPAAARCLMVAMGEEQHVLGLRQLQLAFEDDGWPVTLLGPRVQAATLADQVRGTDPSLVCISAGYLPSTSQVRRGIAAVRELRIPVLVGGSAFNRAPLLWREVGANHHGADARVALVLARRLLR
jgi:methanogenic corrinoid protein MtbC1